MKIALIFGKAGSKRALGVSFEKWGAVRARQLVWGKAESGARLGQGGLIGVKCS